jgi:serine protease
MKVIKFYVLFVVVVVFLSACSSSGPGGSPSGKGEIAGGLASQDSSASSLQSQGALDPLTKRTVPEDLPITEATMFESVAGKPILVPGEVIVKFKASSGLQAQGLPSLRVGEVGLQRAKALSLTGTSLYRAANVSERDTLELAQQLSSRPDVEYATPNYLAYASSIPDDTYYPLQWHYPAIRMPEAWDVTTGSSVVVAVVDSGILYTEGLPGQSHPDLFGVMLPGFDFVEDVRSSGDGSARDADPTDTGGGVFHGSHVAGTIAAATNNGRGVAGVNWKAKIVPVRVLGSGSGTFIDIMEGALWAAGGKIPGIPQNPNPAQVINMSLGGQVPCGPYIQDIFNEIFATGAIVVVAAGNENDDANRYSPASCSGVITVGATDAVNDRAPYSNYGPRIDIMAPGGDTGADKNQDGRKDGVLSLGFNQQEGLTYNLLQGTSMASPHVAGVISLMVGLNPSLTASEIITILRNTADPLTPAACKRDTGRDCGPGLIDAFAALKAVSSGGTTASAGGVLAFNPDPVEFGSSLETVKVTLTNTSSSSVTYSISEFQTSPANPGEIGDGALSGDPLSGTIAAGGTATISFGLDRSKVATDGNYALEYIFKIGSQEQRLLARFSKGVKGSEPTGSTLVASFMVDGKGNLVQDKDGNFVVGGAAAYEGFVKSYGFEAEPGEQAVIAWIDENKSEEVDQGDFIGIFPDTVTVKAGAKADKIDFGVAFVVQLSSRSELKYAHALEQALHAKP